MKPIKKIVLVATIVTLGVIACTRSAKNKDDNSNSDSTATSAIELEQQLTNESSINLYSHFSREIILQKMDEAVKRMTITDNSEDRAFKILFTYNNIITKDLSELLGVKMSMNDFYTTHFTEKFGNPLKRNTTQKDTLDNYVYYWETVDYSHFSLRTWGEYEIGKEDDNRAVIGIATSEPGFGFGGVYVGIPECNKEYISKLFAHISPNSINRESGYDWDDETRGDIWVVELYGELSYTEITISFDKNGVVKKMRYYSPPIM